MNIQSKLLGDFLTEDEFKTLPHEARALWIMRPTREKIQRAKSWMYLRVFLLAVATIYYQYTYGDFGKSFFLLAFLYCYEFAYYTLRKEWEERDYREQRLSYFERVDKFILGGSSDGD